MMKQHTSTRVVGHSLSVVAIIASAVMAAVTTMTAMAIRVVLVGALHHGRSASGRGSGGGDGRSGGGG